MIMYRFWLPISLCIIISFSSACSSEKTAEVGKQMPPDTGKGSVSETSQDRSATDGSYSLEITPHDVSKNSNLHLIPQGFNLSDGKIEWLVNGSVTPSPNPSQFNTAETMRGDKVQARAIVQGKEILSNIIQIGNAPPEFERVKVMPEVFKPGDTLYVEASGTDIDGDEVTILYEWTRNGETAGNGSRIEVPIKRGDKVSVKITPFDGELYGRPIILHREIRNLPPMIFESKEFSFDGKVCTYQIKAEDPDEDPLTFSLKSSPSGMEVDPSTGLVRWDVPPGTRGKQGFTVSVSDGHGGEAVQSLTLEIPPEQRRVIK